MNTNFPVIHGTRVMFKICFICEWQKIPIAVNKVEVSFFLIMLFQVLWEADTKKLDYICKSFIRENAWVK